MRTTSCMIAAVIALAASSSARAELCGGPDSTPVDKLRQLLAEKAQETARDDRYVAYRDAAGTSWVFTLPANPAHPAVVCRRIFGPEGKQQLETNANCLASRASCDRMMDEAASSR